MSLLNIECPICTDLFHNSDDVYGTICGHLFHFACLNDWKRRGSSCPQCRHYNPTAFKLYLSFDETGVNSERRIELKLQKSNEKITQLLIEIEVMETNFLLLEKQCNAIEIAKKDLELKIRQMKDSEENFLKLQAQYTQCSEYVKELEDRVNVLLIENEYKTKEWRIKSLEKESFNTDFMENYGLTSTAVGKRLWTLEQQLKNVTEELEKEINKSSQLTLDKMKLEKTIKQMKKNEHAVNSTISQQNENSKQMVNCENQKGNVKSCVSSSSLNDVSTENIIINLAAIMQFSIKAEDLVNVEIVHDNDHESTKTKLSAHFKNVQLRNEFLSRKCMLQKNPATRSIVVREFLNEELLDLLHYAKENLQHNGFNYFFYKNGKIFAKKNRSHRKVVPITNKCQVDILQQKNESQENPLVPLRTSNTVADNYVARTYRI